MKWGDRRDCVFSPESQKHAVQKEGLSAREGHVASVSSLSFQESA